MCGVHRTSSEECPICLCDIKPRAVARMACDHCFHSKCIRSWFSRRPLTCPLCRSTCLEGMALLGGRRLAPKLLALLRTVPPHPRAFFPTYIIGHLQSPEVMHALGADKAHMELVTDIACESFTKDVFFARMRALRL